MADEMLEKNKVSETFATIFKGIDTFVDNKKVIGDPYTVGDTTIVPFLEISTGMAVGSFNKDKDAGGVGCKVTPVACLVIQNGFTKLINIKNQDAISKALDMIPDLVDKLFKKEVEPDEVTKTIKSLKPKYEKIEKKN